MVHMHYTQPLKIKFGTNHFFGLETLVPIQYRERVNQKRERYEVSTNFWPLPKSLTFHVGIVVLLLRIYSALKMDKYCNNKK